MGGPGLSLTTRGFGECRKLPRAHIFEHLRSNLVCFSNIYFSDYSLRDYLFFTMYINKSFPKSQWVGLTPKPLWLHHCSFKFFVIKPFSFTSVHCFPNRRDSELFIHSFILKTYIAPLQETTTQRRSQPSHGQKRRT